MTDSNDFYLPAVAPDQNRYTAITASLWQSSTGGLEDLASAAKAPRTLEGYANDWGQFQVWGDQYGYNIPSVVNNWVEFDGSPIIPEMIALYLNDQQGVVAPATISRHLAAIRYFHRRARYPSPTEHPTLDELKAGFRRSADVGEPHRAAPISGPDLIAMVEGLGDHPRDVRDKAILTLGLAGGFRRSELVGLNRADLIDDDAGLDVILRRSKTDQEGKGRTVQINYWPELVDPVRATRTWAALLPDDLPPLFRPVNGKVGEKRLSSRTVSRVVKAGISRIGKDPTQFSAHSLRAGHVTWASSDDVKAPKLAIRAITGHASDAMLDKYNRLGPGDRFEKSSTAYMARAFERIIK